MTLPVRSATRSSAWPGAVSRTSRSHRVAAPPADVGATQLGGLEQAVLLALCRLRILLKQEAFGRAIWREVRQRLDRDVASGAVYATLRRLEAKHLVSSQQGAAPARGGLPKRHYVITRSGLGELARARTQIDRLWAGLSRRIGPRRRLQA